nr:MAG TPA: putative protease [Caudoviricetes sp.]
MEDTQATQADTQATQQQQQTQQTQNTQGTQQTQQAQGTQQTQQTQQTLDTVFQNAQQTALGQDGQNQEQNGQNQEQNGQNQEQQQAPDKYDFTEVFNSVFGEGEQVDIDQATMDQFTKELKGLNATQEQANTITKLGMEHTLNAIQATVQAVHQAYQQQITDWGNESRKELGAEFNDKVAQASVTRNYLNKIIPNFTEMLNQTGAGNHIAMIKALAELSKFLKEDSAVGTGTGASMANNIYSNTDFSKY